MKEKKTKLRFLVIVLASLVIFFALGEPFRIFFRLSSTTEVRPVSALPLIFGIVFGFSGTLGCALGNLISDLISGYPINVYIPGLIIQLLYGYLPALIYNHWRRNDKNKFRLDRVYKIVQYIALSIVDSIFCALLIWILIHFVYGTPIICLGFWNTCLNQLVFFIITGIPLLCLLSVRKQKKTNKSANYIKFSLNEKFILFFIGFSIIISLLFAITSYFIFINYFPNDPMKLWSSIYSAFGLCLFLCICPSLLFLHYMEKNVSTPLERMSSSAKEFVKEKDIHVSIEKILMKCNKYIFFSTEIGSLARAYQYMANELEQYVDNYALITAEKEKSKTQLKIATAIQLGALPKPLSLESVDLYASMKPALEVGGDFYDFFKIDDTHLALVIADVSGKGVPASLFMMVSKILLRKNLKAGLSPAQALSKTNQELCEENPAEMFVTCLCGVLDLETNILTFSNAGHDKPAIMRKNGSFILADIKAGFILGGIPTIQYHDHEVHLEPGDIVFAYTDGVPEAVNPSKKQFGNEGLLSTLNASKNKRLEELCKDLENAVFQFNDTEPQFDDITMLCLKIR